MIRRPVIAPGLQVLTDPSGVVQVGLAPRHRLRVPDTPAVRRTLEFLTRGELLPAGRDIQRARSLLEPALRDGDALARPGIAACDAAAIALQYPDSATERLAARARARVRVVGDLGVDFESLLTAVGLHGDAEPTATLMLSLGEPSREPFDALTRADTPHLVVRAVESEIVVGPFVVPGRTACVRCCDLHRNDREPGYTALLTDAVRGHRRDGVPDPVDSAQCWIALGWAVRDLVRHAEGDRPLTWSATARFGAVPGAATVERWPPHPDCSCTWALRSWSRDPSATMDS